ncbi:MAG: class I SAM-dependent methyltransferase [Nanoarchaeota archaeon]|nr:class I SAM-dependent methyltransferase [Nanoarchaeota archaeon]
MSNYKSKLEEWYDSTAERYDSWGSREGEYSSQTKSLEIAKFNEILSLIKIKENTKILDVATGTGIYLIEALKKGGVGYGVDISKSMLEQVKKKIIKFKLKSKVIKIIKGDAEKLPFHSDFFDIVICIGMFEYYPLGKVKTFLEEIKRVLKKEGNLIVDFPNNNNKEVYEFQKKERSAGHEIHIYEKGKINEFLKHMGFRIIKSNCAGIEIQFLLKLVKK